MTWKMSLAKMSPEGKYLHSLRSLALMLLGYCLEGTPRAGILKVEKELGMTVIFGGEVYTVWLRLVTFQFVIFQQWAPHLDNLKTKIKTAETTRYKLCKLWWLWITSDNGERQTRMTGENRRGPWEGYISPFVSFPPSFARTFSSRERDVWVRGRVITI